MPMFIAALFTIPKIGNQRRCPVNRRRRKIYTKECYSAIKKNKVLSFVGKWTALEDIMLSKRNQTEKKVSNIFSYM